MSRRPISVVKSVLHRNCTDIRPTNPDENDNWCEWAPFGKLLNNCNLQFPQILNLRYIKIIFFKFVLPHKNMLYYNKPTGYVIIFIKIQKISTQSLFCKWFCFSY